MALTNYGWGNSNPGPAYDDVYDEEVERRGPNDGELDLAYVEFSVEYLEVTTVPYGQPEYNNNNNNNNYNSNRYGVPSPPPNYSQMQPYQGSGGGGYHAPSTSSYPRGGSNYQRDSNQHNRYSGSDVNNSTSNSHNHRGAPVNNFNFHGDINIHKPKRNRFKMIKDSITGKGGESSKGTQMAGNVGEVAGRIGGGFVKGAVGF
jgi:hypothetical protein